MQRTFRSTARDLFATVQMTLFDRFDSAISLGPVSVANVTFMTSAAYVSIQLFSNSTLIIFNWTCPMFSNIKATFHTVLLAFALSRVEYSAMALRRATGRRPPAPSNNDGAIMSVNSATKVFEDFSNLRRFVAIRDVNFQICEGDVFGLLGPNGAGKTTLMSALMGQVDLSEGSCSIFGEDVRTSPRLLDGSVSFCGQQDALFPEMTVRDHINLFLALRRIKSQTADDVLRAFGLARHSERLAAVCSGGTKRKLSAAIAMMGGG